MAKSWCFNAKNATCERKESNIHAPVLLNLLWFITYEVKDKMYLCICPVSFRQIRYVNKDSD